MNRTDKNAYLIERYKAAQVEKNDLRALEYRNQLIEENIGLVKSIINPRNQVISAATYLEWDDFIGCGVLGIDRALNNFNPNSGIEFTTYAYRWIGKYVGDGVQRSSGNVRLPLHKFLAQRKAGKQTVTGRTSLDQFTAEAAGPIVSYHKNSLSEGSICGDPLSGMEQEYVVNKLVEFANELRISFVNFEVMYLRIIEEKKFVEIDRMLFPEAKSRTSNLIFGRIMKRIIKKYGDKPII